jgi:hypothetical protein
MKNIILLLFFVGCTQTSKSNYTPLSDPVEPIADSPSKNQPVKESTDKEFSLQPLPNGDEDGDFILNKDELTPQDVYKANLAQIDWPRELNIEFANEVFILERQDDLHQREYQSFLNHFAENAKSNKYPEESPQYQVKIKKLSTLKGTIYYRFKNHNSSAENFQRVFDSRLKSNLVLRNFDIQSKSVSKWEALLRLPQLENLVKIDHELRGRATITDHSHPLSPKWVTTSSFLEISNFKYTTFIKQQAIHSTDLLKSVLEKSRSITLYYPEGVKTLYISKKKSLQQSLALIDPGYEKSKTFDQFLNQDSDKGRWLWLNSPGQDIDQLNRSAQNEFHLAFIPFQLDKTQKKPLIDNITLDQASKELQEFTLTKEDLGIEHIELRILREQFLFKEERKLFREIIGESPRTNKPVFQTCSYIDRLARQDTNTRYNDPIEKIERSFMINHKPFAYWKNRTIITHLSIDENDRLRYDIYPFNGFDIKTFRIIPDHSLKEIGPTEIHCARKSSRTLMNQIGTHPIVKRLQYHLKIKRND